jgi:16S rRNA (cytosine967-C5)-methyltransferase
LNTRLFAAKVLVRVLQDGQSLTAALEHINSLSDKDKAFVQAICYGVCRYYYRLDFILSQLLDKPLKDIEIKALALVGLYQLRYMRVKPHAAVSETVAALAKRKSWAKGLVNALLRRYLREQDSLEQQADTVSSAAVSHPDWLINRIQQDWIEYASDILNANNQQAAMVLRVNQTKTTTTDYLALLAEQGITGNSVAFCPTAILLAKPVAVETLPNFLEGWVSVQDTAAQLAASLLNLQAGQRVLDMCAAPGGKAAHILETEPSVTLSAIDIDATRMQRVRDNCQRLQLSPSLIVADAAQPETWWDGQRFDRILLDAPCSGLGVIRRHADIKLLRRPEDITVLQVIQQQLLTVAWSLLAKGGIVLYATCSVLKQENEQQIQQFLANHDDAIELPIVADWGITTTHGRQILTGMSGMDGFYYARLFKNN